MGQLAGDDAAAAGHRDRFGRFGGGDVAAARPARGRGLLAAGRPGRPAIWPGT